MASTLTLTKLTHASVLLSTDSTRILVDPGTLGPPNEPGAYDAVLLTHHHPDHADPGFLREASAAGVDIYGPPDVAAELDLGGAHWHPVEADENLQIGDVEVRVAGDIHAEIHPDVAGPQNRSFFVGDGVYITGDEHSLPPHPASVLVTPMNAPWLKNSDLIHYIRSVKPRLVLGVHEGFLNEAGLRLADRLLGALVHEGADEARRLEVGEEIRL